MGTRNVRDVILEGWEGVLRDEGCHPTKVRALALKLAAVAEGHGVKLSRPAHLHDPVADDSRGEKRPVPGDAAAGYEAALKAHRAAIGAPAPSPAPGAATAVATADQTTDADVREGSSARQAEG